MPHDNTPTKKNSKKATSSQSSPDLTEQNVTMRAHRRKQGDDVEVIMQRFEDMFERWTSSQDAKHEILIQTINTIKEQNSQISSSLEFVTKQYDELHSKYEKLAQEKKEDKIRIQNLELKIEMMERQSRSSCIEIRNIPSKEGEKPYDLEKIVKSMGEVLKMNINNGDIRHIHRKYSKKNTIKPIIVDFSTVNTKHEFLSKIKIFKRENKGTMLNTRHLNIEGPQSTIYISDFLTPNMKRLHFLARDFASVNEYKFCWTTPGAIYLRKNQGEPAIPLKNEQDLKKLKTS